MSDEGSVTLDKYLQPQGAPISEPRQTIGFEFETENEMQGKVIKVTNLNVSNLVVNSVVAAGTVYGSAGTIATGSTNTLNITVTLTPKPPHQDVPNFGILYGAVYQGTVITDGDYQIWPGQGTAIGFNDYHVKSGYNYGNWNGVNSQYTIAVTNVGVAGSPNFAFIFKWKYLDNSRKQE
jgi:hypothetical protein